MTHRASALGACILACGVVACGAVVADSASTTRATTSATLSSDPSLARFEFEQPQMGTTARVVLYANSQAQARELVDRAFSRIAELDSRLSDYRPDSELMGLCRNAGGAAVVVSQDLFTVLEAAQRMAQRTDGAFDVTVGALSRIWRRARITGAPPDPRSVTAARGLVGHRLMQLSPDRTVKLAKAGMLIDLGGIAKGYAADEALAVLRASGAPRALVAIGGDIAAGESPPGKDGWMVDVAPLGPAAHTSVPALTLRFAALSTSGDAEQYVEFEGKRLSHILIPASGRPLEGRRGVTVVARDGITADALATAVSVLGNRRGIALIDATPGAAALIIEQTQENLREYRSARWRQESQHSERRRQNSNVRTR